MGERVVLRDPAPGDVEPFVRAFLDDPPLADALGEDGDPTQEEVRALISDEAANRARGERARLVMADPATDRFAGDVVLHHFVWPHRRVDIGFFVAPARRRQGIGTESVRLACGWAFDELGIARVGLVTRDDNVATQRLAERAGFTREGVLRAYTLEGGRQRDNVVFSMLRSELGR